MDLTRSHIGYVNKDKKKRGLGKPSTKFRCRYQAESQFNWRTHQHPQSNS